MATPRWCLVALALVLLVPAGCGSSETLEPLDLSAAELETVVGAAEIDLAELVRSGRAPFAFELTAGDAELTQSGVFRATVATMATIEITDADDRTGVVALDVLDASLKLGFESQDVDPRLVVSRPGTATYVDETGKLANAAAGEARITHDPVSGQALGLLIEPGRTNLVEASEDLLGSTWFTNGAITVLADVVRAPNGLVSADEVNDQEIAVGGRRASFIAIPDNDLPYTFSVFLKAGTSNRGTIGAELLDGTTQVQGHLEIDLSDGSVVSANNIESFAVHPHADGWFRLEATVRNNSRGNVTAILSVFLSEGDNAATGTIAAWGSQLEQGTRATSYIPALGAATSRAADIVSIATDDLADEQSGNDRRRRDDRGRSRLRSDTLLPLGRAPRRLAFVRRAQRRYRPVPGHAGL